MGRICSGNAYQNNYVTCAIASFQSYILIPPRRFLEYQNVLEKDTIVHITLKEKDPACAEPTSAHSSHYSERTGLPAAFIALSSVRRSFTF